MKGKKDGKQTSECEYKNICNVKLLSEIYTQINNQTNLIEAVSWMSATQKYAHTHTHTKS